jgi:hypothetical protein
VKDSRASPASLSFVASPFTQAAATKISRGRDYSIEDISDGGHDDAYELADPGLARLEKLTYQPIHIYNPWYYINPGFQVLFSDQSNYSALTYLATIRLADGLDEVPVSPFPPSIGFIHSLPTPPDSQSWGVYCLFMEKLGEPMEMYIRSGTNPTLGLSMRMDNYHPGGKSLPVHVKETFERGYSVSHIGFLCIMDIPAESLAPKARTRVLALEVCFSHLSHAIRVAPEQENALLEAGIMIWKKKDIPWRPLCSHSALCEGIRGVTLSVEELRVARYTRYRVRKRAEDEVAFKRRVTGSKKAWAVKKPERVLEIPKAVREKARDAKRFYCDVCDHADATQAGLNAHKKTKGHLKRVAGILVSKPTPRNLLPAAAKDAAKKKREAVIASRAHLCEICDLASDSAKSLAAHMKTCCYGERFVRRFSECPRLSCVRTQNNVQLLLPLLSS